jgi:hypothetical protein
VKSLQSAICPFAKYAPARPSQAQEGYETKAQSILDIKKNAAPQQTGSGILTFKLNETKKVMCF